MKNYISKLKWIFTQSKSALFPLLIIVILGGITSITSVYRALASKTLIDSATYSQNNLIARWTIILISLLLIEITFKGISSVLSTFCTNKISNKLQEKIFKHITYSEWLEESNYHSVNLLTRLTNDVDTITNVIVSVFPGIISLLTILIFSFITLLSLDPIIAIVAIVFCPALIVFTKLLTKKLKKYYIDIQDEEVKYRSFIQESINNTLIVKSFTLENSNINKLKNIQATKSGLAMKRSFLITFVNLLIQLGVYGGNIFVMCFGAFKIAIGSSSFGTLTALLQLFSNIQGPFAALSQCIPQIISAIGATERLMEIEALTCEDTSKSKLKDISNNLSIAGKNINFSYKEDLPILKNINFNINPSEIVALVGPSGEGKTTLIRLILSLIHPTSGNAYISNSSINEDIIPDHRNLISYVPQGNTLFSGTIEENLKIGNKDASMEDIIDACKIACAYDFIDSLDDKFNTLIGEKGLGISEGQAQRLAIARSLLKKSPILILDEATSSLDGDTELRVLEGIKSLKHKPTCIIITHRPSALQICNRIFKLQRGYLKEIECPISEVAAGYR